MWVPDINLDLINTYITHIISKVYKDSKLCCQVVEQPRKCPFVFVYMKVMRVTLIFTMTILCGNMCRAAAPPGSSNMCHLLLKTIYFIILTSSKNGVWTSDEVTMPI